MTTLQTYQKRIAALVMVVALGFGFFSTVQVPQAQAQGASVMQMDRETLIELIRQLLQQILSQQLNPGVQGGRDDFDIRPSGTDAAYGVVLESMIGGRGVQAHEVNFGAGEGWQQITYCYAPADLCLRPGRTEYEYDAAGSYTVKVKNAQGNVVFSEQITIDAVDTTAAQLQISKSANSPAAMTIEIDEDDESSEYDLLIFDIAERNKVGVEIESMSFKVTTTGETDESNVVEQVLLYQDGTQLDSTTVSPTGVVTFDDLGVEIDAGETEQLTLAMTFAGAEDAGLKSTVQVSFVKLLEAEDENGNSEREMSIRGVARSPEFMLRTNESVYEENQDTRFSINQHRRLEQTAVLNANVSGRGGESFTVDFGDGRKPVPVTLCDAPSDICLKPGQTTHTYREAGTYQVTVYNRNDRSVVFTDRITIEASADDVSGDARFSVYQHPRLAQTAVLNANVTGRGGEGFTVDFGDGRKPVPVRFCSAPFDRCVKPGQTTHAYREAGTYEVTVYDRNRNVVFSESLKIVGEPGGGTGDSTTEAGLRFTITEIDSVNSEAHGTDIATTNGERFKTGEFIPLTKNGECINDQRIPGQYDDRFSVTGLVISRMNCEVRVALYGDISASQGYERLGGVIELVGGQIDSGSLTPLKMEIGNKPGRDSVTQLSDTEIEFYFSILAGRNLDNFLFKANTSRDARVFGVSISNTESLQSGLFAAKEILERIHAGAI